MEYPFNLPVKKIDSKEPGSLWIVIDKIGMIISFPLKDFEADYIVQAINNHDKLVKYLKNIDTCLAIMANTKSEEGIKDLPNLIANLRKYVEEALKEAKGE